MAEFPELFPERRKTALPGGYMGKILRVDLTTGSFRNETLPEEPLLRKLIGGQALATYILLHELPLDAEPFGPENKVVMMTGPITGTTNVNYLPFFVALQKGFYREEGIDLQVIYYMASTLTSKTVLTGDVDYSGAVSGVVGAAVQGQALKVVMFTVARPLLFLISKKEITQPQQLKGKTIAGSTPGASATLLATQALRYFGLEPGRDVAIMPMGGSVAGRYAILESGSSTPRSFRCRKTSLRKRGDLESCFSSATLSNCRKPASARRTKRFAKILTRSTA